MMIPIKSIFPYSSFTRIIMKSTHNLPLDFNSVYRYTIKKNKTSFVYNHLKDGYVFNNSLNNFDSSLKIQTRFKGDPFVITEKIQSRSMDNFKKIHNDYYLMITDLKSGVILDETITNYVYLPDTKFIEMDLQSSQSKLAKKLLNHIDDEVNIPLLE